MIQLSQSDFQRLTHIVQNLPDFANVRDRRRLVADVSEGVSQSPLISGGVQAASLAYRMRRFISGVLEQNENGATYRSS